MNNDNQIDGRDFLSAAAVNALGARVVAVRVDLTATPDQTNQDVKKMGISETIDFFGVYEKYESCGISGVLIAEFERIPMERTEYGYKP